MLHFVLFNFNMRIQDQERIAVYVKGAQHVNRATDGDVVAVEMLPTSGKQTAIEDPPSARVDIVHICCMHACSMAGQIGASNCSFVNNDPRVNDQRVNCWRVNIQRVNEPCAMPRSKGRLLVRFAKRRPASSAARLLPDKVLRCRKCMHLWLKYITRRAFLGRCLLESSEHICTTNVFNTQLMTHHVCTSAQRRALVEVSARSCVFASAVSNQCSVASGAACMCAVLDGVDNRVGR